MLTVIKNEYNELIDVLTLCLWSQLGMRLAE